jgi:hypothetical protein
MLRGFIMEEDPTLPATMIRSAEWKPSFPKKPPPLKKYGLSYSVKVSAIPSCPLDTPLAQKIGENIFTIFTQPKRNFLDDDVFLMKEDREFVIKILDETEKKAKIKCTEFTGKIMMNDFLVTAEEEAVAFRGTLSGLQNAVDQLFALKYISNEKRYALRDTLDTEMLNAKTTPQLSPTSNLSDQ